MIWDGPVERRLGRSTPPLKASSQRALANGWADLKAFLPEPENPFYMDVLCELVRVDLEYSYDKRQPRSLEDYKRCDSLNCFRDPERANDIAFEESRLRQGADHPAIEWPRQQLRGRSPGAGAGHTAR